MRRHVVNGAEILHARMPILAPVVAFELSTCGWTAATVHGEARLDEPRVDAVRRRRLRRDTVAAQLQRPFRATASSPSSSATRGSQLDQNLVRRFTQLLGIYPPGNLVKLSTNEIAVVLAIHAPDPHRPRVRVIFAADGSRLELPFERNLWEPQRDRDREGTALETVTTPVDPADYNVDPLIFLEN